MSTVPSAPDTPAAPATSVRTGPPTEPLDADEIAAATNGDRPTAREYLYFVAELFVPNPVTADNLRPRHYVHAFVYMTGMVGTLIYFIANLRIGEIGSYVAGIGLLALFASLPMLGVHRYSTVRRNIRYGPLPRERGWAVTRLLEAMLYRTKMFFWQTLRFGALVLAYDKYDHRFRTFLWERLWWCRRYAVPVYRIGTLLLLAGLLVAIAAIFLPADRPEKVRGGWRPPLTAPAAPVAPVILEGDPPADGPSSTSGPAPAAPSVAATVPEPAAPAASATSEPATGTEASAPAPAPGPTDTGSDTSRDGDEQGTRQGEQGTVTDSDDGATDDVNRGEVGLPGGTEPDGGDSDTSAGDSGDTGTGPGTDDGTDPGTDDGVEDGTNPGPGPGTDDGTPDDGSDGTTGGPADDSGDSSRNGGLDLGPDDLGQGITDNTGLGVDSSSDSSVTSVDTSAVEAIPAGA